MGISSLGVGSNILTQDLLDQLRAADEAQRIQPITLEIANETDKQDSLKVIDATMTNLIDSINELKSATLFDGRATTVSGTSVEVTASANSDIQDFNITVNSLATKQIEESGAFAASTDTVATDVGTLTLSVGSGTPVTINYDATTTLAGLKDLINANAGDQVDATIVQVSATESRLIISSVGTGSNQDISITDNSGFLDTKLTTGLSAIQTGADASFTFNGQAITRSSNQFSDLITGYDITLKEPGSSDVSVVQDRDAIMAKVDSFVEKYNAAITELSNQTKSSTDSAERGIFSGESLIKGMKNVIQDMIASVTGGVGSMEDYGFVVDKAGKMTIDKTLLNSKLDENPTNVEAFFTGGDFTKADGTVVTLTGAFVDFSSKIDAYTQFNGFLDQLKGSLSANITSLEDRKTSATARLDAKYMILKKQFTAYDAMIAKLNNASAMFTQLANAQTTSQTN